MRWTDAQHEAITARGQNLLVSAAAGSGKTAVITERAIRLILDEAVSVDRLLMMTFTNAAAAEMRQRLSRELEKRLKKGENVPYLREQLELLGEADICTMHSYCITLLRRHFHAAGIDPNFAVMAEEGPAYTTEAIKQAVDAAFEQGSEDFHFLCDALGGRSGKKLEKLVLDYYQFARSRPNYRQEIARWSEQYNLSAEGIAKSDWMTILLEDAREQLEGALACLQSAKDYALKPGGPVTYLNAIDKDIANLTMLCDKSDSFESLQSAMIAVSFGAIGRKSKHDDPILCDIVKSLREKAKKLVKGLGDTPIFDDPEKLAKQHQHMAPAMAALCRLALDFDDRYRRMKDQKNVLDFSDLMHYALLALEDEGIAQSERDRYDHVFIDEYQDTNLIQEALIERISRGDNLFCVGDVKQSIYAFRQAEPWLFLCRRDKSQRTADATNRLIDLNANFRSAGNVIDGINLIFDTVMSPTLGGVEYDEFERLYAKSRRPESGQDNGSVELLIIDGADRGDDEQETDTASREAALIAKRIKELMGEPIWDGKKGIYRPLQYNDICILSRGFNPIVRNVRRVLECSGIPVNPKSVGGYFDELEVKQTLDILQVIDNHRRDVALISAMRSPAFGFDFEEILAIRRAYDVRKAPFYEALEATMDGSDRLSMKVRGFMEQISRYRDLSRYVPLRRFIWQVLDETAYYDAVGALPGGAVRQANLRLLMDRAGSYANVPGASLFGYLSYMEHMRKSAATVSAAQDVEGDDGVQFMSVHQSKGLEMPVVFLMSMGSGVNLQSNNAAMPMYRHLGPGVRCYHTDRKIRENTLANYAVSLAHRRGSLSEDVRVLYVALTRARERLIMVGTVKKELQKTLEEWTIPFLPSMVQGQKGSFLNLVGYAAMNNAYCDELRERVTIAPKAKGKLKGFTAHIVPAKDIMVNMVRRAGAIEEAFQQAAQTKVTSGFSYRYPNISAPYLPSKTSATAIIKGNQPGSVIIPERYDMPKFLRAKSSDAARRGTLTHTALQHLPYDCDEAGIQGVIDDLMARNILPEDAKDCINVDWLLAYLDSDIARRVKTSPDVRKEVPFVVKMKGCELYDEIASEEKVLVQGIIDLCFMEDGEWVLVDYKTNWVQSKEDRFLILEHYRPQLEIYATALERITKRPVKQKGLYLMSVSDMVWLPEKLFAEQNAWRS